MNEVSMYARPSAYKMTYAAKFPSSLAQVLFNFRQCEDYSKEFFIDNFRNQVKGFRSTIPQLIVTCQDPNDLCFSSPCIVRTLRSITNKTCFSALVVVAML